MPGMVLSVIGGALALSMLVIRLRRRGPVDRETAIPPAPGAAPAARHPYPYPYPSDLRVRETYTIGGDSGGMPLLAGFAALSLVGAIISLRTHTQSSDAAAALFIGLPVLVLIAAVVNLLRRRRLPRRLVLRGHVVRLWTVVPDAARTGGTPNTPRNLELYYCVLHCPLDDVQAPENVRLKLNQTVYHRLYEGELVDVLVDPRRRRIKDLRPVEDPG